MTPTQTTRNFPGKIPQKYDKFALLDDLIKREYPERLDDFDGKPTQLGSQNLEENLTKSFRVKIRNIKKNN